MAKRLFTFVGVACAALFFLAVALLVFGGLAGGSCGCTLPSGRSVSARSDGWSIAMTSTASTATITTSGCTIVVAPAQLLVNGQRWAAIDPAARSIEVTVEDGEIALLADGALVRSIKR